MKFIIGLLSTLCLLVPYHLEAGPLTIRCSGFGLWGDQKVKVQIEIVLPEKKDRGVMLWSKEKQKAEIVIPIVAVGLGTIQINEQLGEAKSSHRHQFFVTRLPDNENSLIGFYFSNSYVNTIRVDLWKKDMPFTYFDTYNNEIIQGTSH